MTLTRDEFLINAATSAGKLTITNASGAANLLLGGNAANRIFDMQSGANFTLNGVTVQNGNSATSTITDCGYDGDGKADVAVFRPSNGTWYGSKARRDLRAFSSERTAMRRHQPIMMAAGKPIWAYFVQALGI